MVEGPWGSLTQQSSLSEANSCQFPNTPTTGKDHLQEHHGQARQKLPQEVKVKEGGNLLNIWLNKTSMHIMHDLDTKINRNGLVRAFCLLQNLCQIPFPPSTQYVTMQIFILFSCCSAAVLFVFEQGKNYSVQFTMSKAIGGYRRL